jgi:hypothetical protein
MNLTYILKKKKDKVAADAEDLKVRMKKPTLGYLSCLKIMVAVFDNPQIVFLTVFAWER